MRPSKIIVSGCLLLLALLAAYGAFMYVYTENMFTPLTLLTAPQTAAPHTPGLEGFTRFIHRVNTPARARQKDHAFAGFEVDVWWQGDELLAAHDEREALAHTPLSAIFAAVKQPAQKMWWLDIKQELSVERLEQLRAAAAQYQIPAEQLLFEMAAGPSADVVQAHGYRLLLQLPEGFEQDGGDASRRSLFNTQVLALWEKYHPVAVAASFGKYGSLRTYFPQMPKAIYYSSTARPSLKKALMSARMKKDPSVRIFMTDEYTYLPF